MRVLIDARMVGPVGHGIARYVQSLARGLREVALKRGGDLGYEPIFLVSDEFPGASAGSEGHSHGFEGFETLHSRSRFLSPREWIELTPEIYRSKANLFHSPSHSVPMFCPVPWIVTLHDLNHRHFGSILKKLYMDQVLKRRVERASRVLSVSDSSAREIANWLDRDPKDIEVVRNVVAPEFSEPLSQLLVDEVCASFSVKRGEYFFALSNPKPHKNLRLLVEAHRRYELSCRGVKKAHKLVLSCTLDEDSFDVIQAPRLTDFQTRALMRGASALCFPSVYEGFGLPPLEALVSGTPVILSDIASHREALDHFGGETCVKWAGAHDVQAWSVALAQPLGQVPEPLRQGLLELYSISRLGYHMDRLYRDMLGLSS